MSLSTNSWDIVYTSKLGSVNNALTSLFKCKATDLIQTSSHKLNFSKFQVAILPDSSDTEIKLTITFEGKYATDTKYSVKKVY